MDIFLSFQKYFSQMPELTILRSLPINYQVAEVTIGRSSEIFFPDARANNIDHFWSKLFISVERIYLSGLNWGIEGR